MVRRLALCGAVAGIVLCGSARQSRQVQAAPPSPAQPDARPPRPAEPNSSNQVWSPLHAFLGIDPVTGQFKPAGGGRHAAAPPGSPESNAPADLSPPPTSNDPEAPADMQVGEMTLDELRASLTKAIDQHDEGALTATLASLTRGAGYESFSLLDPRIERLGYALLFLYPLGIVLSEFYGIWSRRRSVARSDFDRRFYARQRNRRFTLAACSTATIGLFWWAAENSFWWNDAQRLAAFAAGLTFLLAGSAILRLLIARAAKDYPTRVIEQLRLQQLALEKEIQELRRRLQGGPLTKSTSQV
jgi:hypothetical protein